MLSRRDLLASAAQAALPRRKPNFLFLIADDHAGYVLGCDGNREAHTPNLDRLADEGTRFAQHYCNSPVCTPSRQSFLTGQLPHSAGVTVLRTALSPEKPTIAKQLKQAGYRTAVFGKMHLNRAAAPGLHGFDVMMTEGELTKAWNARPSAPVPDRIGAKPLPWRPFQTPAKQWLNAANLPYPRRTQDMRSAFLVNQAARYLEENRDKQFALWVSFQEPHSPFDFPYDFRPLKDAGDFKAPRVGPQDASQIPLIFRDLSDAEKTGIIAAYYNSAAYLDYNIGLVLAQLRALNLEEDTLVVYMADHGYSLGQHGRFEKHCCYDPALRVPLIIRWPGKVRRGVVDDFTESVDVPHTILDLLGAPPFDVAHGQSLRPYLEGKRPSSPRDHIFSEYLENEEACIRTEKYKFIFCTGSRERTDGYKTDKPRPGRYVRLYDLKKDPGEFKDIAPSNAQLVKQFTGKLLDRFRATHPDAAKEPKGTPEDTLAWYLRPRDGG